MHPSARHKLSDERPVPNSSITRAIVSHFFFAISVLPVCGPVRGRYRDVAGTLDRCSRDYLPTVGKTWEHSISVGPRIWLTGRLRGSPFLLYPKENENLVI